MCKIKVNIDDRVSVRKKSFNNKIKTVYALQYITVIIEITVLSASLGKTFFVWHFILNENILFLLTISYQKTFVFYISVFCSQTFTLKLNL